MKEWLKKHDIPLRVLSLLLAFMLWFFVVGQEDPTKSLTFREMPVELIGLDALKSSHSLILADDDLPTVSVEVNGAVSKLSGVSADKITVRADVSSVTQAGEYSLTYDISVPNGVTVVNSTPSAVKVHFGDLVERELPVEVVIDGVMREGYVALEPELGQSTVSVSGLAEEMARAAAARIEVDADVLNRNYETSLRYDVVDAAGQVIKSDTLVHNDIYVRIKVPVQLQKLVDLSVGLVAGKGVTEEDAVVSIEPSAVLVQGEIEAVRKLENIELTTVDLASTFDSYNGKLPIVVPEGFELLGEQKHAQVNISFQGITNLTFRTDDIELINVPDGYHAELREKEMAVTVRGPSDMVAGLVSGDVSLQVDMRGRTLAVSGSLAIPATVILGENVQELGVFGTYTVYVDYEKIGQTPVDPEA
ncbi:MAG: hypothetical protein E7463_03410 [Ruminococcaceae bacterium]|nr:hypothetical protein [Oscillospiraceae bacterium]